MNNIFLICLLIIDYILYPIIILFILKYIKNNDAKNEYIDENMKEKELEFNRYIDFSEVYTRNYSIISPNYMYNSDYKKARENNLFNVMYLFEEDKSGKKFYFFDLLAQSENKIIHYSKVKNISLDYFISNRRDLERKAIISDIIYIEREGLLIYDGRQFIRLLNDEMFTNIISTARNNNGGNMANLNLISKVYNQITIHNNG